MKITGSLLQADVLTPIVDANVIEIGTNNRTTTDSDGKFTINVSSGASMLKFSHVQYDFDTVLASDFHSYYELYLASNEGPTVHNGYTKQNSTALIVVAALAVLTAIGVIATGKKPTKVKI
jgi:hypothetical protein